MCLCYLSFHDGHWSLHAQFKLLHINLCRTEQVRRATDQSQTSSNRGRSKFRGTQFGAKKAVQYSDDVKSQAFCRSGDIRTRETETCSAISRLLRKIISFFGKVDLPEAHLRVSTAGLRRSTTYLHLFI